MTEPLRIFVGSSPHGLDAESDMVLEYSIRKNTSIPVEIHWMRQGEGAFWTRWRTEKWATPFSGFRWGVPAACDYEGRAVYMDNDIVVQGDVAELARADLGGKPIMARWPGRLCVAVWDCAEARTCLPPIGHIRSDPNSHARYQQIFGRGYVAKLDPLWNCLDGEDLPIETIKALHFTDMSTQPAAVMAGERLARSHQRHWYTGERREHRRSDAVALFRNHHAEALTSGYCLEDYEPPYEGGIRQ